MEYSCAAFPDGMPEEIFEGEFDHREPYPGDNGIQFEKERSGVLVDRYLFSTAHNPQEMINLIEEMFEEYDTRRAQGSMEPPLQ